MTNDVNIEFLARRDNVTRDSVTTCSSVHIFKLMILTGKCPPFLTQIPREMKGLSDLGWNVMMLHAGMIYTEKV